MKKYFYNNFINVNSIKHLSKSTIYSSSTSSSCIKTKSYNCLINKSFISFKKIRKTNNYFFRFTLKSFSNINNNNANTEDLKYITSDEEDLIDNMKEEFNKNNKSILEEINKYDTSNNKSDADIRLKKLSFELVSFSNSNEVLELYEKEIFNNKEKKELSTSEELILILYFYVKLAEKENINQGNINKKNNLLVIDIIELLSNKLIKEIEYNNNKNDATIIKHNSSSFLALCYSISSIPKLGFKLPMKLIETLILTLNHKESINDIINNVNDIPSICFSLTNILSDINDANELNNESISKDIELIVIRCIYFYCKFNII